MMHGITHRFAFALALFLPADSFLAPGCSAARVQLATLLPAAAASAAVAAGAWRLAGTAGKGDLRAGWLAVAGGTGMAEDRFQLQWGRVPTARFGCRRRLRRTWGC